MPRVTRVLNSNRWLIANLRKCLKIYCTLCAESTTGGVRWPPENPVLLNSKHFDGHSISIITSVQSNAPISFGFISQSTVDVLHVQYSYCICIHYVLVSRQVLIRREERRKERRRARNVRAARNGGGPALRQSRPQAPDVK